MAAAAFVVYNALAYRKMAHSAEDIASWILARTYGRPVPKWHSDVKHGFVIGFAEEPDIDLARLEHEVSAIITQDLPIAPADEDHIRIGDEIIPCTGVRMHVRSTAEIESFRLLPALRYNPITREHLLVGIVGDATKEAGFDRILSIIR